MPAGMDGGNQPLQAPAAAAADHDAGYLETSSWTVLAKSCQILVFTEYILESVSFPTRTVFSAQTSVSSLHRWLCSISSLA